MIVRIIYKALKAITIIIIIYALIFIFSKFFPAAYDFFSSIYNKIYNFFHFALEKLKK